MARRKEFKPEEALEKAMRYFWQYGYNDTSIRDLISGTGVNFYGLYSVFGDKRGIYVNSLERYCQVFLKELNTAASVEATPAEQVRSVFKKVAEITLGDNEGLGCMVCNAAVEVAPTDEGVAEIVTQHRTNLTAIFKKVLSSIAQTTAEIEQIPDFLATQVYMIGFLARSGKDVVQIEQHIEVLYSLIDKK